MMLGLIDLWTGIAVVAYIVIVVILLTLRQMSI